MASLFAEDSELVDIALKASGVASLPAADWGCPEAHAVTIKCPHTHNRTSAQPVLRSHALDNIDKWFVSNFFCDVCRPRERTFVELGAGDGIGASNTKMLEDQLGFKGVLIEGHPVHAKKAIAHRSGRNVIFPEAVCREAGSVIYAGPAMGTTGVLDEMSANYLRMWGHRMHNRFTVPCRPISAMLELASVQSIDMFSLDVEGSEFAVLQTFNWRIPVRSWIIEMDGSNRTREDDIRRLLATRGYAPHQQRLGRGANQIFVHRSLWHDLTRRREYCSSCS